MSECLSCKGIYSECALHNGSSVDASKDMFDGGLGAFMLDRSHAISLTAFDVSGGEAFVHKIRLTEQVQLKGNFLIALIPRCCGPCAIVHRAWNVAPRLAITLGSASVAASVLPYALDMQPLAGKFWPVIHSVCCFVSISTSMLAMVLMLDATGVCAKLLERMPAMRASLPSTLFIIAKGMSKSPMDILPRGLLQAMYIHGRESCDEDAPALPSEAEA